MRKRYTLIPILLLAALTLVVSVGNAAKPTMVREHMNGTPVPLNVTTLQNLATTCTLGITDPGAWIVNYIYPPEDGYYTLLDPALCNCTGTGGVLLATAHALLNFPMVCSIPVRVGIVAADLTDPACPVPIKGQYLCPPATYNVSVAAIGNYDITFPLPAGCCITQKAFLEVTFMTSGTCTTVPKLITSDICNGCTSYNIWPGSSGYNVDDLCIDIGFPGNPVMFVDATCCDVVPAHTGTWGRLKVLYR